MLGKTVIIINCPFLGNKVGEITSGCPSPSLGNGQNVSMGYVEKQV